MRSNAAGVLQADLKGIAAAPFHSSRAKQIVRERIEALAERGAIAMCWALWKPALTANCDFRRA